MVHGDKNSHGILREIFLMVHNEVFLKFRDIVYEMISETFLMARCDKSVHACCGGHMIAHVANRKIQNDVNPYSY